MTATEYLKAMGERLLSVEADGVFDDAFDECVEDLAHLRTIGGVVHLIGNGGSAAMVAHAQNDLVKGGGIKALVHQDIPLLTAFANDNGYARSYADALARWIKLDDVLIAVSSSGASPNILQAAEAANNAGATVITLSGFAPDNPLRYIGHYNFYVPSFDYGQVETTHGALLHCLTDRLAHAR